jgi:hypothetical protein
MGVALVTIQVETGAFTDAVDSHYMYCRSRILQYNSARVMKGLLAANDWPPENVAMEAFYLLTLGEGATARGSDTPTKRAGHHLCQWVWVIAGQDLNDTQRAKNRTKRFRLNEEMKAELLYGLYPGFCEKQTWALNSNGAYIGSSYSPVKFCRWPSTAMFTDRHDKASGLIYGMCSLYVSDYLPAILA